MRSTRTSTSIRCPAIACSPRRTISDAADVARAAEIRAQAPGSGYARPDGAQARSVLTTGANIYFAGHDFKLQLNYVRRTELEDWEKSVANPEEPFTLPASREVDDNSFVAQLTYRL